MSLYNLPAGPSAPDMASVVVEIPKGSRDKVEATEAFGRPD